MEEVKFVVNPWKLAFYFIFLANIAFHASAAFLLLLLLLVIFAYAYVFLGLFFSDFAATQLGNFTNVLSSHYAVIETKFDSINKVFRLSGALFEFSGSILRVWVTSLLTYRCEKIPVDLNLVLLPLEEYYAEEKTSELDSILAPQDLDLTSQVGLVLDIYS